MKKKRAAFNGGLVRMGIPPEQHRRKLVGQYPQFKIKRQAV
jgi:hypothetical protein